MRSRRIVASLVSGILAGAAFAGSAHAQDFSAEFTSDREAFVVAEVGPESFVLADPQHFMSGGNPGGFIGYADPDSGATEKAASFVPPITLDEDQIGRMVSFDLRWTGGTPGEEVFFAAGDFENPAANGFISCDLGAPASSWSTYSVAVTPDEPCWRNYSGSDATASDFNLVFGSPSLFSRMSVNADFSSQAGEQSDLDNFVLEEWVQGREIALKYKKRSQSFGGVVSQDDGAIADDCINLVAVHLFQEAGVEDKLLEADLTDANGKYKIAKKAKKNKRYYAIAPKTGEAPACAAATSKTIKPL